MHYHIICYAYNYDSFIILYLSIFIIYTSMAKAYALFTAYRGKYPVVHSNMESFRFLAVMLLGTVGNCTLVDDS